jgi:alkanesulfonate monooxygenase SsuD/methylene tetrahydromethanopterin reductase-like flavin-dependent oxidoreductase (luciferase family)
VTVSPLFGTLLPTRELAISGTADPTPVLDIARRLDTVVDSLWIGESVLARPRMDAYSVLAAVAGCTSRVTLGTAVVLPSLRNPVAFAHAIATIDAVSRGRLVLGVGAGFPQPDVEAEFANLGADYRHRISGLEATIAAARAIWRASGSRQRATDATGRFGFADVAVTPPPQQPGGPSTWLATASPAGLVRCGSNHDGWLPYSPTPEEYRSGLDDVRAAAVAAGRAPSSITPGLYVTVAIGQGGEPHARLESYCRAYYGHPAEVIGSLQALIAGPLDSVVMRLSEYVEAGAEHVVIRHATLDVGSVGDDAALLHEALHAASSRGGR